LAYILLGSGLFPFNPDRALKDMPRPITEMTNPEVKEVREEQRPQYEALPTPATPMSAEALNLLLNVIHQVPDDSESSRQRKERLQYKIITAAQTSFAKNALLEDRNQFLTKINDESKPRRITKSVTLGKARVMSYEDLEKARAQRAAKEAAKEARKVATEARRVATAGKGKLSRKGKKNPAGAGALEPEATTLEMSEAPSEESGPVPEPWRAPVARMW